jgi:hypothetical protein
MARAKSTDRGFGWGAQQETRYNPNVETWFRQRNNKVFNRYADARAVRLLPLRSEPRPVLTCACASLPQRDVQRANGLLVERISQIAYNPSSLTEPRAAPYPSSQHHPPVLIPSLNHRHRRAAMDQIQLDNLVS